LRDARHSTERYFILYELLENPRCSVRKISKTTSKLPLPLASSPPRVWRHIHGMNITCGETIKRPQLTERSIKNRLHFSNMADEDVHFSLPWFFSDECVIELNPV
jgi:hypothetical protein